jgi:hypothetical protein
MNESVVLTGAGTRVRHCAGYVRVQITRNIFPSKNPPPGQPEWIDYVLVSHIPLAGLATLTTAGAYTPPQRVDVDTLAHTPPLVKPSAQHSFVFCVTIWCFCSAAFFATPLLRSPVARTFPWHARPETASRSYPRPRPPTLTGVVSFSSSLTRPCRDQRAEMEAGDACRFDPEQPNVQRER